MPSSHKLIDTTLSSLDNVIPFTPIADLPIDLISFSSNLIDIPSFVTKSTSLFPSVTLTPISSSSSLNPIAINPALFMFLNSSRSVFLTIPFLVANNKYLLSSFSSIANSVAIFSLGPN